MRMHAERFTAPQSPAAAAASAASGFSPCCDLLIADEAHRLKNAETLTYGVLLTLPCKRRVLLSGTPMQNNLDEFFAMADLVNPGVFGEERQFRKQLRRAPAAVT
jgi:SNF2 family DNA or RNA helicase